MYTEFLNALHKQNDSIHINGPAITAAVATMTKEREELVQARAVDALKFIEVYLSSGVRQLRDARKAARLAKEKLQEMDRAAAYFGETGNPLPFYTAVGGIHQRNDYITRVAPGAHFKKDDPIFEVPADWQPSQAVASSASDPE